jgi:4-alpha-glucanotransferase
MADAAARRRAGILIPLFSIPSEASWGIGEIDDIPCFAHWLLGTGLRIFQLLPINEMPDGETSPYSALSAMAIDPQYISPRSLEDFDALGGEEALEPAMRDELDAVRLSPGVDYPRVRRLKTTVLRQAFTHFRREEWANDTRRAGALRAYIDEQAWWLEDYALFRALHAAFDERPWTEWPEELRDRRPAALEQSREDLEEDILYRQYLQWVADGQWSHARRQSAGVSLFGDLPFMVSGDSADVWARQDQFRLDASVGVPPDAFSETGQDWGLPVYRWDVQAAGEFEWLRRRARRNVALFDGYRVDHLVGFYRTYFRPHDGGEPQFTPATEEEQTELGERVLRIFGSSGAEVVAEDLGIVPDFVRASLARLGIPGYKVFRWEREWGVAGQPFVDPADYPRTAIATSGTHDTEPLTVWWESAGREERIAVLSIPSVRAHLSDDDAAAAVETTALTHAVHEALLAALFASSADLLILPMQDAFGWRDRVNQPATVSSSNWTWRLLWPVDRLPAEPQAFAIAAQLREWSSRYRP